MGHLYEALRLYVNFFQPVKGGGKTYHWAVDDQRKSPG